MAERIERIGDNSEKKLGWRKRYKAMKNLDLPKIVDHKLLTKYENDNIWKFESNFKLYPDTQSRKKREDLFTNDGYLKVKHFNVVDYKLALRNRRKEITELKDELDRLQKRES